LKHAITWFEGGAAGVGKGRRGRLVIKQKVPRKSQMQTNKKRADTAWHKLWNHAPRLGRIGHIGKGETLLGKSQIKKSFQQKPT